MSLQRIATVALVAGAAALAGCQSTSRALGLQKVTPDEYKVVSKAPLTLPPDYALRPPHPGQPRPQELQPESAARTALLGQRQAEQRDDAEKLLATKAGADKADPLVRYVVDDEFGGVAHKDKSFSDTVMFWHKGAAPTGLPTDTAATTPAPIDPSVEAKRIQSLTGNQPVVISRGAQTKEKLPGL